MSPIPRIYKSIIANVQTLISTISDTTGNRDIQYFSWDARFEENDLPRVTLLGPEGFTFEEDGGLWRIRYGLTLSTWQDANLLDEIEILGIIHEKTGERTKLPLFDETSPNVVEQVSELYCSHWEVAPGAQTSLRNYRSIGIELLRAGE